MIKDQKEDFFHFQNDKYDRRPNGLCSKKWKKGFKDKLKRLDHLCFCSEGMQRVDDKARIDITELQQGKKGKKGRYFSFTKSKINKCKRSLCAGNTLSRSTVSLTLPNSFGPLFIDTDHMSNTNTSFYSLCI